MASIWIFIHCEFITKEICGSSAQDVALCRLSTFLFPLFYFCCTEIQSSRLENFQRKEGERKREGVKREKNPDDSVVNKSSASQLFSNSFRTLMNVSSSTLTPFLPVLCCPARKIFEDTFQVELCSEINKISLQIPPRWQNIQTGRKHQLATYTNYTFHHLS